VLIYTFYNSESADQWTATLFVTPEPEPVDAEIAKELSPITHADVAVQFTPAFWSLAKAFAAAGL
jgi:hypothetical protein